MAGGAQNIHPHHRAVRPKDKLKEPIAMKMFRPGDHGNLGHYRIQHPGVLVGSPFRAKKVRHCEKHQNDTEYFSERGHVSDWRTCKPATLTSLKRSWCCRLGWTQRYNEDSAEIH
jgi:hypothetical protein